MYLLNVVLWNINIVGNQYTNNYITIFISWS